MTSLYAFLDSSDAGNAVGGAVASFVLLLFILVGGALAVAFYLLPLIIAVMKKSHLVGPVAALNILLGWTLMGWVGALVLALMPRPQATVLIHHASPQTVPDVAAAGGLSDDGQWRWDGRQWRPAAAELTPAPNAERLVEA
jgi:hypothetical protein